MAANFKKSLATFALLVILLASCGKGPSLSTLNALAASGSIHPNAPVSTTVEIQINAKPERVWALLVDVASWPKWNQNIESVSTTGPLRKGTKFSWKTGGTSIQSQVQLFEPPHRLAWTGTAFTAKAIHVWELASKPQDHTLVVVKESMDGPFMATVFPSSKLKETDLSWLSALKKAAETTPSSSTPK